MISNNFKGTKSSLYASVKQNFLNNYLSLVKTKFIELHTVKLKFK